MGSSSSSRRPSIDQEEERNDAHDENETKAAAVETLQGVAAEMTLQRAGSVEQLSTPKSKNEAKQMGAGTGSSKGSVKDGASVKAGSSKDGFLGGPLG